MRYWDLCLYALYKRAIGTYVDRDCAAHYWDLMLKLFRLVWINNIHIRLISLPNGLVSSNDSGFYSRDKVS